MAGTINHLQARTGALRKSPDTPQRKEIQRIIQTAKTAGSADHYTGKRRWTRFNAGMACEITNDPAKPASEWFVSLHNVSGGGFACWSKKKVTARARIFIREFVAGQSNPHAVWLPARVCHCTPGLRGYLIGASFEDPVPPAPAASDRK